MGSKPNFEGIVQHELRSYVVQEGLVRPYPGEHAFELVYGGTRRPTAVRISFLTCVQFCSCSLVNLRSHCQCNRIELWPGGTCQYHGERGDALDGQRHDSLFARAQRGEHSTALADLRCIKVKVVVFCPCFFLHGQSLHSNVSAIRARSSFANS